MNIYDRIREEGRSPAKSVPVSRSPKTARPVEFYRGQQFQHIRDWQDYVRTNPELQGFGSITAVTSSDNPRVRQFGEALRDFLHKREGLSGRTDLRKYREAVRSVLDA